MNDLHLLAINLTRRCNLACNHCYLDATSRQEATADELTTREICILLDEVAARSNETMVVLTGGEPLLRSDLESIISHGTEQGLFIVLGTNGTLLTDSRVQSLKQAGLKGMGISVDSLNPVKHDRFRGRQGCWQKTMAGIEMCRRHGLSFQVHFTVTRDNLDEISDLIEFSHQRQARVVNIFFLICTGRGETICDIDPEDYERILRQLVKIQADYPDMTIRVRCAPHSKRVAMQLNPDANINSISGRDGDGCIAGIHYCRITPEGGVTACPFIDEEVGNIKQQKLFDVWDTALQFQSLRQPNLQGKCGLCEYRALCGGCRARPLSHGESLMASDPWCSYEPQSNALITPLSMNGLQIEWQEEASKRLRRIPGFIRRLVKRRAEAYVMDLGESLVTCHHLDALIAKRFGGKRPPFASASRTEKQE